MSLTKTFDAAVPPLTAPAGCGAVLGYIGGRAEHVWTLGEWLRFAHLRQFPCWVADFTKDPLESAAQATIAARALGWRPIYKRALVYDTEASVDRGWCLSFADNVALRGFLPVNYGSASVVAQNGSRTLWVADWDGDPQLEGGQGVEAHQYASNVPVQGTKVDFSVISLGLLGHGGQGART